MFAESPCFKVFVLLDSLFRIVAKSVWPVITCRYGIIVARVTASINALPSQAGNSLTRFRIGVKCGSSLLWYYARCANWLSFHLLRLPHTVYRMTASPPNWRVPFSGTLMSADLGRVYERSAAPRSNQPRNRGNVSLRWMYLASAPAERICHTSTVPAGLRQSLISYERCSHDRCALDTGRTAAARYRHSGAWNRNKQLGNAAPRRLGTRHRLQRSGRRSPRTRS